MDTKKWLRKIPKVDQLLAEETFCKLEAEYGYDLVAKAIRQELKNLRRSLSECEGEEEARELLGEIPENVQRTLVQWRKPSMVRILNGTGTILHTNLGRAPVGEKILQRIYSAVEGYSNLEYDLEEGNRGERYAHFEELLCRITGAEAAIAVNNNAAAVLLILSAIAKGGEVIVSRGELVEIGGKFRIPDVMEQSGAILREIGTTNKTRLSDYEQAVCENTKAILKVHTSNYQIVGFTQSVETGELLKIKETYGIPLIEDLGSGVLVDLSKYGLTHEPTVQEILTGGADIVSFSGDKLLGGCQAGIIVGRRQYVEKMKRHPLTRALRIDKFAAAILEQVLLTYLCEEKAVQDIPALNMLTRKAEEIRKEAETFLELLQQAGLKADLQVCPCESQVGGGALPLEKIASYAVSIRPTEITTAELEKRLRTLPMPVVARVSEDRVCLDLRTFEMRFAQDFIQQLKSSQILDRNCPAAQGKEQ